MATFKLGAIITEINGSIGGTTFKKSNGSFVMYNKSRGASPNILAQNTQLGKNGRIFKLYSQLETSIQEEWEAKALLFLFPNKYGILRNLTGRQLFTKLNIQKSVITNNIIEPNYLYSETVVATIQNFDISISTPKFELQVEATIGWSFFLVQLEVRLKKMFLPQFSRRKVDTFMFANEGFGFDVTNVILEKYPYITDKYFVRAFVTPMNEMGFKGQTVYKDGIWYDS